MAEYPQPSGFPKGVKTPSVTALDKISFNGGYEASSVQSTSIPLTSGMQVGTADIQVAVATSGSVSGIFIVRFNINGFVCSAVISSSMRLADNKPDSASSINILSFQTVDPALITLKNAFMAWGNGEVALVLNYRANAGAAASGVLDVFAVNGNTTTLSPKPYNISTYPNINQSFTYTDCRDQIAVQPNRVSVGTEINLNNSIQPALVTCNPATSGSKPTLTTGVGSCLVLTSNDSNVITQLFSMSDGLLYTRNSIDKGATWSSWTTLLNTASKTDILKQASDTALIWAIIMG